MIKLEMTFEQWQRLYSALHGATLMAETEIRKYEAQSMNAPFAQLIHNDAKASMQIADEALAKFFTGKA